jgi:hypothetical protein
MAETDIASAEHGDFKNTITDYSVDSTSLDTSGDQKETTYQNANWTQQLGYYKKIPEIKSAIDAIAKWTIGKGFQSNEITEMALSALKGWGKGTFNAILANQIKVSKIGGDSYAEIIRDEEGDLINLKPLNPETMIIVVNKQGLIKRYEQTDKIRGNKNKRFKVEDVFHLSNGRVGDEIHGISIIDAVEDIILARNEAITDYKKLLHRTIYPVKIFHLDTDDTTEIAAFKAKADKAHTQGENMYIPKGVVEIENSAIAPNSTLNPLPWINQLTQNFYQEVGVPQIIVGGAQEITEASAKIAYLAWEQTVELEQLYVEEQILSQLNLEINLEFPASLQNELLSDNRKSETMQASTPEDTSVQGVPVGGVQ